MVAERTTPDHRESFAAPSAAGTPLPYSYEQQVQSDRHAMAASRAPMTQVPTYEHDSGSDPGVLNLHQFSVAHASNPALGDIHAIGWRMASGEGISDAVKSHQQVANDMREKMLAYNRMGSSSE